MIKIIECSKNDEKAILKLKENKKHYDVTIDLNTLDYKIGIDYGNKLTLFKQKEIIKILNNYLNNN